MRLIERNDGQDASTGPLTERRIQDPTVSSHVTAPQTSQHVATVQSSPTIIHGNRKFSIQTQPMIFGADSIGSANLVPMAPDALIDNVEHGAHAAPEAVRDRQMTLNPSTLQQSQTQKKDLITDKQTRSTIQEIQKT